MNFAPWPAALLFACVVDTAHANRPLNTDTADTIPQHVCQFEPYAVSTRMSGAPSLRDTILQLNCGVSSSTQLGLAATRSSSAGQHDDNLRLSGKTNVVGLKDDQTGIAVGYGIDASKPAGGSWAHDDSFVYLIATRQLRPDLLGHVNLGGSRSRSARQYSTTWAAALEWSLAPRWVWSAETYGDDRSGPWWGTGLWWGVREHFSVNVSFGVQRATPRAHQASAGFNLEF
ncbi:MAG: hypothetical protein E6H65_05630 [Betaproteobacteria bacterium]|nr:MAG: hypothetical protein E6H65_05630 [Betaproteobacteria bacterium]